MPLNGCESASPEFPVRRFAPMARLLDDSELFGVDASAIVLARLRAQRRKIFHMYAMEFRRQSIHVTRLRLAAIGRDGEWDELPATCARAMKLFGIWLKFQRAWVLHGWHVREAPARIVTDSLRSCDALLASDVA